MVAAAVQWAERIMRDIDNVRVRKAAKAQELLNKRLGWELESRDRTQTRKRTFRDIVESINKCLAANDRYVSLRIAGFADFSGLETRCQTTS